ncbi:MAG TPA: hypothetical protein DCY40_05220 [Actinobacteria bacterium]|nr:hypothetical protein [Actinomycetota bacterium]
MTRRLVLSLAIDLLALVVAVVASSLLALDHALPWVARPHSWGMLGAVGLGAGIALFIALRPQVGGVWIPSYGRAVSMAGIML